MTGIVIGYDPGGNDKHGVARATVRDGIIQDMTTRILPDVESVISFVLEYEPLLGIGVDTLTCWATGKSGFRPADLWLRDKYPDQRNRVVSPNSLSGSMSINGMALLVEVRRRCGDDVFVTETHPKVLYYALRNEHYDYQGSSKTRMNRHLCDVLRVEVEPQKSHEWDAAISILPVVRWLDGSWPGDLHTLPTGPDEHLIRPCGNTSYVWPQFQGCAGSE